MRCGALTSVIPLRTLPCDSDPTKRRQRTNGFSPGCDEQREYVFVSKEDLLRSQAWSVRDLKSAFNGICNVRTGYLCIHDTPVIPLGLAVHARFYRTLDSTSPPVRVGREFLWGSHCARKWTGRRNGPRPVCEPSPDCRVLSGFPLVSGARKDL